MRFVVRGQLLSDKFNDSTTNDKILVIMTENKII